MIGSLSRYKNAEITMIAGPSGARMTILPTYTPFWQFSFTFYAMKDGDRLELLAMDLYGSSLLWWKIADANPEILDWSEIAVGTVFRLPSG